MKAVRNEVSSRVNAICYRNFDINDFFDVVAVRISVPVGTRIDPIMIAVDSQSTIWYQHNTGE